MKPKLVIGVGCFAESRARRALAGLPIPQGDELTVSYLNSIRASSANLRFFTLLSQLVFKGKNRNRYHRLSGWILAARRRAYAADRAPATNPSLAPTCRTLSGSPRLSGRGHYQLAVFYPAKTQKVVCKVLYLLSLLPWAALTGALVPVASGLLTGMPPFYPPIALVMSIEGALMAAAAAVIYHLSKPHIWPALVAAVVLDRMVSAALMWLMAGRFGLPPAVISAVSLIQGLPGVALQLLVVPLVVRGLRARKGILLPDDDRS